MIEPNETHILKAVAWDALWLALDLQEKTADSKSDRKAAANWKKIMDDNLDAVAANLADPETWRRGKENENV